MKGKLILGDRTIELSEETTKNLIKDLGLIPQKLPWVAVNRYLNGTIERIIVRIPKSVVSHIKGIEENQDRIYSWGINGDYGAFLLPAEMLTFYSSTEIIISSEQDGK